MNVIKTKFRFHVFYSLINVYYILNILEMDKHDSDSDSMDDFVPSDKMKHKTKVNFSCVIILTCYYRNLVLCVFQKCLRI